MLNYSAALLLVVFIFSTINHRKLNRTPVVNGPRWFEPTLFRKLLFFVRPVDTILKARLANKDKPFRLLNYAGEITVLPPIFADAVGNDKRFSLGEFLRKDFYTHVAGQTPVSFMQDEQLLVHKIVKRFSTKTLPRENFRRFLVKEIVFNIDNVLGSHHEWCDINTYDFVLDVVARVDVHAFWGNTLGPHYDDWIKIAKTNMPDMVASAVSTSLLPRPLQFLVPLFSPHSRRARQAVEQAQRILVPIVQKRRRLKTHAVKNGLVPPLFDDAIEWAEKDSNTPNYNIVDTHLAMRAAVVHTSADLVTEVLILLAQHQDTIHRLREEMTTVLLAKGLSRDAFQRMELLDSVLKETLRYKPASLRKINQSVHVAPEHLRKFQLTKLPLPTVSIQRAATTTIHLSPDIIIPKGTSVAVDMSHRLDPTLYPDPHTFQPDRFLRLRKQPEWATKALFASTSPEHLAFGYGHQACPGRFFVDVKVKMLMCHLLLAYDWELVPGTSTQPTTLGPLLVANHKTRVRYRKRRGDGEVRVSFEDFSGSGG